jgi:hypothetical protein
MPRQIKRRKFEAITPTLGDLKTKLESVRREVRNLTIMGMDPNQTTEQAALIKKLERRGLSNGSAGWPLTLSTRERLERLAALSYSSSIG